LLHDIPEHLQRQLGVGAEEDVTFIQTNAEAYWYRDAVRFTNGREVLLQSLNCRQRVEVISLCSGESRKEEHQRREEEYRQVFAELLPVSLASYLSEITGSYLPPVECDGIGSVKRSQVLTSRRTRSRTWSQSF
jgi:hypothetical protein